MNKKRLGNDPFDDIDILKGPDETREKQAGKMTSHKTSKMTSQTAGKMTSHKTSQTAGNMTSDFAITKKDRLRKMTYYFREDQLKELDKLSKRTGRDRSELARMAFDLLIDAARKND